ncbi:DUF6438 domain-containing protein [Halpernia sp. GG3]
MLKYILLFFGLFLLNSCEKKTLNEKEILELIHSKEGYKSMQLRTDFSYGENFIDSIKSFRKIVNKENFKPLYEADFNNDGKQDYLLNLDIAKSDNTDVIIKPYFSEDSKNCLILLSNKNGYQFLNPGKKRVYAILSAKIINFKGQNLIKLLNFKTRFDDRSDMLKNDTLMIKNNQLTEFVKPHQNHKIEKIIFTQISGYAPGITYKLTLKKDSTVLLSNYYERFKGNYSSNNFSNFPKLSKYFNEINFTNLKDKYLSTAFDSPTKNTKIFYDNGEVKIINDYNERGTLGLVNFYEKMDSLMAKQNWQKID